MTSLSLIEQLTTFYKQPLEVEGPANDLPFNGPEGDLFFKWK